MNLPPLVPYAATSAIGRGEAQPGTKVLVAFPSAHIQADFADQDLRAQSIEPWQRAEIDSAKLPKLILQCKIGLGFGGFARLAHFHLGRLAVIRLRLAQMAQGALNLLVALGDERLIGLIEFHGLAQGKEMFLAIIAFQGSSDLWHALAHVGMFTGS